MKLVFVFLVSVVLLTNSIYCDAQNLADNSDIGAMIIGNAGYTGGNPFGTLNFPSIDVNNMRECLAGKLKIFTKPCFDIQNSDNFMTELSLFKDECKKRGIQKVIIYYSGHGTIALGENFLVPVSFKTGNVQDIYTGTNPDIISFIQKLNDPSADEGINAFKESINNYLVSKKCVAVSRICNELKDYEVILISDACRSKIPIGTKGSTGTMINNNVFLTQWCKDNLNNPRRKRVEQFIADFNNFYQSIINANADVINQYSGFTQTITDPTVRKHTTTLYGTNLYNPAYEDPAKLSSKFTSNLISTLESLYAPQLLFDQNLVDLVFARFSPGTVQHPVIVGAKDFTVENAFHKQVAVNKTNILKTISPAADGASVFSATSIVDKSLSKPANVRMTYALIANIFEKAKLEDDDGFLPYFEGVKCPQININYWVSVPDLQLSFQGKNSLIFYAKSKVLMPVKSSYELDTVNCAYKVRGAEQTDQKGFNAQGFQSTQISDGSMRDYDNYHQSAFELAGDSVIMLKTPFEITKMDLLFDQLKVTRIGSGFDTLAISIQDSRPWKQNKQLNLILVRADAQLTAPVIKKKKFFAPELPYTGGMLQDAIYQVTDLNPACDKQSNNAPLKFPWTSGEYQAEVILRPRYSDLKADSLIGTKAPVFHININDVTACSNPFRNCGCYTQTDEKSNRIVSYSFSKEILNADFTSFKMNFKIYSRAADKVRIAFPIYQDNALLSKVEVKSLQIRLLKAFDSQEVDAVLSSQDSIRHQQQLAQAKLDQQRALEQRMLARKQYDCSEFQKASLFDEEFNGSNIVTTLRNSGIEICQITGDGFLQVGRRSYYAFDDFFRNPTSINYEFETEMSFRDDSPYDADVNKAQYVVFDGTNSGTYVSGLYFAKYKSSHSHYLEFGYRDGNSDTKLTAISVNSFTDLQKIMIRKIDNDFYVFFNGNFKTMFTVNNYKPGNRVVIDNKLELATDSNGDTYLRQLQRGGNITFNYIRINRLL